jgi:hypothetical protein
MASIIISHRKELSKSKRVQDVFLEYIIYLVDNAIIPMLEADDLEFEQKFNEAIKYYSFFTIQFAYMLGLDQAKISRVSMAKSFLSIIHVLQEEFLKLPDDQAKSIFITNKMKDYLLLASDPKINVYKTKYTTILEASYSIWICIIAFFEITKIELR